MSLARAVISGTVYRTPEKRFTGNNIPVTSLTLKTDDKEPFMLRVTARGNLAETLEQSVSKGARIIAEGRLQITAVQAEDGTEKKITEIDLSSFEISAQASVSSSLSAASDSGTAKTKQPVEFSEIDMTDTLIGEEEIPF